MPLKNCKSLYQNIGGGGAHTSESLVRELLETPLRRRLGARRQVSAVLQVRAASGADGCVSGAETKALALGR